MDMEAAMAELERRCHKVCRQAVSQCRDVAFGVLQEAAVFGNPRSAGLRSAIDFGAGKALEASVRKALEQFREVCCNGVASPVDDRRQLIRCFEHQLTVIFSAVIQARDDEIKNANIDDNGTHASGVNFMFHRESMECLKQAKLMLSISD